MARLFCLLHTALMSIPDFRGRTAEQIVNEPFVSDSAWHINAALSWTDYVKRTSAAIGLHYAHFICELGSNISGFKSFGPDVVAH
jgi:hypothetical protein